MILMRIIGARPQFMQEVVFRREIDSRGHKEILVHTGQHYDGKMSQIFFDELKIPKPDVNLGVGSGGHGYQTGRMLELLDSVIDEYGPDVIVVDGDTNSTLAGALCAAKLHVPIVHIEAGMRSFDRRMPEEINRIVADHLGGLLCVPTANAMKNLEREGLADRAVITGDLMYDCFLYFRHSPDKSVMRNLGLEKDKFLLATVHRAENIDDPKRFEGIIRGLCSLPAPVVLPAHPRVRGRLSRLLKHVQHGENLRIIDPVSYLQMLALEQESQCVLTDSGGVQREAFFAGKPSVILRNTTEWLEQVECGWSYLAGADTENVIQGYHRLTSQILPEQPEIYGGGKAATRTVNAIEEFLA